MANKPILRITPAAKSDGIRINISIEAPDGAALVEALRELLNPKAASVPLRTQPAQEPVNIRVPFPIPAKLKHQIAVNDVQRNVPAAVARVAGKIAKGERKIRIRSEVIDKLSLHLPELLAGLGRDHDRKVNGKGAMFNVADFVTVEAA